MWSAHAVESQRAGRGHDQPLDPETLTQVHDDRVVPDLAPGEGHLAEALEFCGTREIVRVPPPHQEDLHGDPVLTGLKQEPSGDSGVAVEVGRAPGTRSTGSADVAAASRLGVAAGGGRGLEPEVVAPAEGERLTGTGVGCGEASAVA